MKYIIKYCLQKESNFSDLNHRFLSIYFYPQGAFELIFSKDSELFFFTFLLFSLWDIHESFIEQFYKRGLMGFLFQKLFLTHDG